MKIKARLLWTLELSASDGGPLPDAIRNEVELTVAGLSERLEAVVATVLEHQPGCTFNFDAEEEEP